MVELKAGLMADQMADAKVVRSAEMRAELMAGPKVERSAEMRAA